MEGHSSDIDDPAPSSKERTLLIEEPAMVIEGCKTDKGRPTSAYDVLCGSGCDSNLELLGPFFSKERPRCHPERSARHARVARDLLFDENRTYLATTTRQAGAPWTRRNSCSSRSMR